MSIERADPDEVFPFPSYRPYQRAALHEASAALFDDDSIDTVVLNLPTGIGKSPINTALARQAESAFMTTPQKALRTQLENDTTLREYYAVLRARQDYTCPVGSIQTGRTYNCKNCPINRDDEDSCLNHNDCTYWNRKESAMAEPIAVLTFSYLVLDSYLPVYADTSGGDTQNSTQDDPTGARQVSFADRELLIVDECHKLEDQVASLHAGISISPYSLPLDVFGEVDREIGDLPEHQIHRFEDYHTHLEGVYDRAQAYIQKNKARVTLGEEESQAVRNCRTFSRKFEWCRSQVDDGRDWVINREETTYNGTVRYRISARPVDVDQFLQDHIWSRADTCVLSTATMPFSETPARWLTRLGLNPDTTHIVQYPMPFPAEQRPVHTNTVIAKMSQGGYAANREQVIDQLRRIANHHHGEKGLIHTASYERASDLSREFPENSVCHTKRDDGDLRAQIDQWHGGDHDMFFSPAATDGVDLPYDECRWQVLVKAPYPQPSDPRIRLMLDERNAWDWYYEITCQAIQQSVGRGVRSMDDRCDYYVLDASFFDIIDRASVPSWFEAAIENNRHHS